MSEEDHTEKNLPRLTGKVPQDRFERITPTYYNDPSVDSIHRESTDR